MSSNINKDEGANSASEYKKTEGEKKHSEGRRDALRALATIPILGAMTYGVYKKRKVQANQRTASQIFNVEENPVMMSVQPDGKLIRLGIIGFGIRGEQLMQAIGFATP